MIKTINIVNPYTPLRRMKDWMITAMPDRMFVWLVNARNNYTGKLPHIFNNAEGYLMWWGDVNLLSSTPKYLMNPTLSAYEKKNEQFVRIDEGDTVVDVGACMGDSTLPALLKAGVKGRVIAVEPSPQNLVYLRKNVGVYKNCFIIPKAVFNKKCTIPFSIHNTAPTGNSIGEHPDSTTIDVEADTLDNMLEPYGHIDFLKIDVQGLEVEALEGCTRLMKDTPKIVVETHGFDEVPLWVKVSDILEDNGYCTRITADRRVHACKKKGREEWCILKPGERKD